MMRLKCPRCQQAYLIPDERIPAGMKIVFPCPSCKKGLIRGTKESQEDVNNGDQPSIDEIDEKAVQDKTTPVPSPSVNTQLQGRALKSRLLQSIDELPSLPEIIIKAQSIMADPRSGLKELASLVKTDQAIVTKALRLANSAYYGLSGKVSSIEHATVLLGGESFGELITMSAASKFLGRKLKGYNADSGVLWRHSLAVAFGSKIIARRRRSDVTKNAFTAGIIHDAGKLVLDQAIFERKEKFDEFLKDGDQTVLAAERKILGFDHAEIASDICKKWSIPDAIAISIKISSFSIQVRRKRIGIYSPYGGQHSGNERPRNRG
ncbi:MAG: HDOD domain-containing protein [Deltaproteobacteria bacterium]|nr:HDOD domain-containing protein [Deltaproteobacteria bacterium]